MRVVIIAAPKVSKRINGYKSVNKGNELIENGDTYYVQPNVCPNEYSDRRDTGGE